MILFIAQYIIIAVLFGFILQYALEVSLQYEEDKEIIQLFADKKIKYFSIALCSAFWLITILIITCDEWRNLVNEQ